MSTAPALRLRIQELRDDVSAEGEALVARWEPWIVRRDFAFSARNLAHYLALRRRDLRRLQESLMPWGLSSLGRCESRVLPTLDGVLATLDSLCREKTPGVEHPDERTYFRNKGPYLADAVNVLGRVLSRMQDHQYKKTPQLRALRSWR